MAQFYLGVDGGGTKTLAAIVDERGLLRGAGKGGPSNYDDVGVETARDNIGQAVAAARAQAGLAEAEFNAVFLGLAGVVAPHDRATVRDIALALRLAAPPNIGVDHDCRIALAGALAGRPGIVQIAGTGSSTFGVNAEGESWRAGGWGQLISDEGSGYWLGVMAIQAATRSFDGRDGPTMLLEQVQSYLGLDDLNDVMRRLYVTGMTRADIAAMAPLVIDAANAGDRRALLLIEQGTQEIADCVLAVAQRLKLDQEPGELALVGGLLQAGATYLVPLRAAVATRLPQFRMVYQEMGPVFGACLLALQSDGVQISPRITAALQAGSRETGA